MTKEREAEWPGPKRIKQDVARVESCRCRRFYASTDDVWVDKWGWFHTQKKCGPDRRHMRESPI